jgi:glyoxylase-like metal-dependent hydrolase (beta-lactamase superfamily II)
VLDVHREPWCPVYDGLAAARALALQSKSQVADFVRLLTFYAILGLALLGGCGVTTEIVGYTPAPGVEIIRIELAYSNAYVIRSARPILIDSGSPGELTDIRDALADHGLRLEDLALVVLTHGHGDHSGGAAAIRSATKALVALGKGDLGMAAAGKNTPLPPTNLTARLIRPFVDFGYPPFVPDIAVDELDLAPYGIRGKVVSMPGHTPGSLVVLLENRSAFVGDEILGGWFGGTFRRHSPGEHYYQDDVDRNHKNIRTLLERGVETFYLGHGGPVVAADVESWLGDE